MRRGRIFILLALILLLGAVAVFFVLRSLGGSATEEGPPPEEAEVLRDAEIVIAAQDIARGAEIPADGVIVSPYPAEYLVETMLTDPEQVIGHRARMEIARGVPITLNMITEEAGDLLGAGSDAAIAIPQGFTGITIPMDRLSGVAFALRDGDKVDVLISMLMIDIDPDFQTPLPNVTSLLIGPDGTLQVAVGGDNVTVEPGNVTISDEQPLPQGKIVIDETTGLQFYVRQPNETPQRPRLVTQRLIANATVLHVGTFPILDESLVAAPAVPEEGVGAPAPGQEVVVPQVIFPDVVTLIVSPQDALALNWAVTAGADLVLTLKNPDDPSDDETDSVTLQFLIDNYDISVPTKLGFGIEPALEAPSRTFPPEDPGAQVTTPQQ